jgi:HSP20 family protein
VIAETFEFYHVLRSHAQRAGVGRDPWYDSQMPWDPMRDLRTWQERLSAPHLDPWTPPIDVYETTGTYVVAAELPGLTREQIELACEGSRLTIRGRRTDRAADPDTITHYHQVERGHGSFARTFEFAEPIDIEGISADLAHGVLTVTLPKSPAAPMRRIEVR